MARYCAALAYDGTAYHGFQRQANASSIQAEVEAALERLTGSRVSILGAGRTDAGVHAAGQVIAFDLDWSQGLYRLRKAINAHLPEDIVVSAVAEAADDFHPRYDALKRRYRYDLYTADEPDPLRRHRAWHLTTPLNVGAMQEAADCLVGTLDYSSFGTPPQGDNSVRMVFEARWASPTETDYHFYIAANAFLYRMVRSITATLVQVGQGRMTVEAFQGILVARDRSKAASIAPAHGLTLTSVTYE